MKCRWRIAQRLRRNMHATEVPESGALPGGLVLLNLYADWHPPCADMNQVFQELSRTWPALLYYQCQAEEFPEMAETLEISSVPTFVVLKDGKPIERLEGANAPALSQLAEKYATLAQQQQVAASPTVSESAASGDDKKDLTKRLQNLIKLHPIMIFIKGTPAEPRCGFSRQAIDLLKQVNASYGSFDILSDESVRAGLKELSNWPTYPQIYVNGELIGGLDILKEMIASGDFQAMMPKEETLEERLGKLVKKAPVLLFMKGNPEVPRCGFSRQEQGITFETFDILEDEEVRQGLKEFSNWPTFPQLYVEGELMGGLDIVKEMIANGDLQAMIPASSKKS